MERPKLDIWITVKSGLYIALIAPIVEKAFNDDLSAWENYLPTFLMYLFWVELGLILIVIFENYYSNFYFKFDKAGIIITEKNNLLVRWEDIVVTNVTSGHVVYNFSKYTRMKITSKSYPDFAKFLTLNSHVEKSIIELTKKYAPSDNVLFKEIEKYAQAKKIKF